MEFPIQLNTAFLRKQRGFTLIEIMVVVAIVAILAAIAYPSYEDAQRRSRRADAQSDLMQLAQFSEKFFTENLRYDQDRGGAAYPLPYNRSPHSGGAVRYNITFASPDGQTYTLTATPVGSQASDVCGTLTINQAGVTTPASGTDGRACW